MVAKLRAPDPSGKQHLFWDADLKGFGVLCSGVTNTKTYVVQRVVGGKYRRVTVGQTNVLKADQARQRAESIIARMTLGEDPKAKRAISMTLGSALNAYLISSTTLRPSSKRQYRDLMERHLIEWLDKPLAGIDGDMVEREHRRIAEDTVGRHPGEKGGAVANLTFRCFRAVYNFAAERDSTLPQNPVRRLKRSWFASPRRDRLVRDHEMAAFHRAVCALPNPTHSAYLRFLLYTGLRRREAAVDRRRPRGEDYQDPGRADQGRPDALSAYVGSRPRLAGLAWRPRQGTARVRQQLAVGAHRGTEVRSAAGREGDRHHDLCARLAAHVRHRRGELRSVWLRAEASAEPRADAERRHSRIRPDKSRAAARTNPKSGRPAARAVRHPGGNRRECDSNIRVRSKKDSGGPV
jgi:hypothetical protein